MLGRKARTIRHLVAANLQMQYELEATTACADALRKALAVAMDPYNSSIQKIEDVMAAASADADSHIVQMPDGEFVVPDAYDWDRLAQAIIESQDDTGGASGSWE